MKTLITLEDFILKTDKDFPASMSKIEMQDILLEKYKSIVAYTKFLNKELTIEMFEGGKAMFLGGMYNDIQPSTQWNYYSVGNVKVFQDRNGIKNGSIGKKVKDIAHLKIGCNFNLIK